MTLLAQYQDISTEATRREAVFLVSRMMRYRMDMIAGLEEEVHDALQEIRDRGNRRKFRRSAKRLARLVDRIEQLSQDSQYDAVHLAAILRFRHVDAVDLPDREQDDPVRYIT
ncbi:MAG: hypothetical protein A4E40_00306 [Methanoregulaceae archaeon PtaU1.Bin059]|nr:MAG: hypothetical protein A4E37_00130 [Methanoregulaceae archaeon PtaB.Bin056]OPY42769.1 MAG: hypothetical protein A4E40_00306 [Methanoregulaceae archaeon PtaU1.Bin059]